MTFPPYPADLRSFREAVTTWRDDEFGTEAFSKFAFEVKRELAFLRKSALFYETCRCFQRPRSRPHPAGAAALDSLPIDPHLR
jgi:hypothetical protein